MTQIVATFTDCGSSIICIGSIAFNSDNTKLGQSAQIPSDIETRTHERSESREKTN